MGSNPTPCNVMHASLHITTAPPCIAPLLRSTPSRAPNAVIAPALLRTSTTTATPRAPSRTPHIANTYSSHTPRHVSHVYPCRNPHTSHYMTSHLRTSHSATSRHNTMPHAYPSYTNRWPQPVPHPVLTASASTPLTAASRRTKPSPANVDTSMQHFASHTAARVQHGCPSG